MNKIVNNVGTGPRACPRKEDLAQRKEEKDWKGLT